VGSDLQYKLWVNPRHGVNEHTGSVDPRTEHVRVGRLGPAGVRQVPVDVGRTEIHPVLGGNEVSQAVGGTRHLRHFRMSGRAAREEHLHRVRAQRPRCLHNRQHGVQIIQAV